MLTIARLRPDRAERSYYERTVASSREDYYAGAGEAAGEWFGEAAVGLGLEGEVEDGDLSALLRGEDPASGRTLRTPPAPRDGVRTRIDPDTGSALRRL
ncbi:MAG: relaxase domain-containing protein [Thermoleophilia bacterium]